MAFVREMNQSAAITAFEYVCVFSNPKLFFYSDFFFQKKKTSNSVTIMPIGRLCQHTKYWILPGLFFAFIFVLCQTNFSKYVCIERHWYAFFTNASGQCSSLGEKQSIILCQENNTIDKNLRLNIFTRKIIVYSLLISDKLTSVNQMYAILGLSSNVRSSFKNISSTLRMQVQITCRYPDVFFVCILSLFGLTFLFMIVHYHP